jgi:uncharacterized membrane protein
MFVLLAVLWNIHTQEAVLRLSQVYNKDVYVSSEAQIDELIANPSHVVTAPAATLIAKGYSYLAGSIGAFNGSYVGLPFLLALPLLMLVWLSALIDSTRLQKVFTYRSKIILLAIILAQVLAIGSIFYIGYTPVGSDIIEGIQGRYFTILLVLALPLLAIKGIEGKQFRRFWLFPVFVTLALVWSGAEIAALYAGFLS